MKQSDVNEYNKALEKVMSEYLASNPDPEEHISSYISEVITGKNDMLPLTWFDAAATTALIRNHKDAKDQYDVHPCTIELMVTLFRIANHKLNWLDDNNAWLLAGYLSYDKTPVTREYVNLLHELIFCILRFPITSQIDVRRWYYYLLPILAYTKQYDFKKPCYVGRYLLSSINKYGLLINRGDHNHDIATDVMYCREEMQKLMMLCKNNDRFIREQDSYNFYRNVLTEFATVMLGCVLQRSATVSSFGVIAREVVALHHIEYQIITQQYHKQQAAKENSNL